MFSKLKQIKNLRDKAKEIQSALAEEIVDVEYKGIKMQMDGNQKVKFVQISDEMMADKIRLEAAMVELINEGVKKVQKAMATKLSQMGNLDLPGLS
jgi:DNA-binding protein YbaB